MTRIDDDALALHLEVALSGAAPALLGGLADQDRRRRHAAFGEIARHLVGRLRCFDIRFEGATSHQPDQPSLFAGRLERRGLAKDPLHSYE